MTEDRLPPQNIEAERTTLGSLLIDPEGLVRIADSLKPQDFYRRPHQLIFTAISDLYARSEPADIVTVCEELDRHSSLEDVGGEAFVSSLANDVPTPFHLEHYANIVKRAAVLRRLIVGAGEISSLAYSSESEWRDILDGAESIVFGISHDLETGQHITLRKVLTEYVDQLHFRHERPDMLSGVPTGFPRLDEMLGGFQRSNLVIVAARTGVGKTTFMLNIAWNAALKNKVPVVIFTLEVAPDQLCQRLISMQGGIDSSLLRDARLTDGDFQKVSAAVGELSECPIFIDDSPSLNVIQLRAKCRRLQAEHNVGLVVIDYLQLMHAPGHRENRVQEISEITRSLKAIARELEIPVIAGAQLSRAIDSRPDQKPRLSDLRESGSIEQDADIVMFLYAEASDIQHSGPLRMKAEIAKHRNGAVGEMDLVFLRNQGVFLPDRGSSATL